MQVFVGDRIQLTSKPYYSLPYELNATGTVVAVASYSDASGEWIHVGVEWDNGMALTLMCPPDQFEKIDRNKKPRQSVGGMTGRVSRGRHMRH